MPVDVAHWDTTAEGWRARGRAPFAPGIVTPPPDPEPDPDPSPGGVTATAANTGVPAGTSLTTNATTYHSATGLIEDTNFTAGTITVVGSGVTFRRCRFAGEVIFRGDNVTLDLVEAGGFSFSGTDHVRGTGLKAVGGIGKDAFHITSDTGQCVDIQLTRLWASGNAASLIGASGNHYDSIQVRGVNGLTLDDFVFDQGTTFNTLFMGVIYLENANGGNANVTLRNGVLRGAGYNVMTMAASGITLEDLTMHPRLAGVGQKWVNNGASPFTQTRITDTAGNPVTLVSGE